MPEVSSERPVIHSRTARLGRMEEARHRDAFLGQRASKGTSQRSYSTEVGVPRSTLQGWVAPVTVVEGVDPALAAVFTTAAGTALLQRIELAIHLVVGFLGTGGVPLVRLFLLYSGLDAFLASSYGTQRKTAMAIQSAIVAFEAEERPKLAAAMAPRAITVVEDETFMKTGICLVAQEPVSGFLLLEEYAEDRKAETWKAALDRATGNLPVKVDQITSDEAKALLAHAEALGAHHSPDLFHVQHEVCGAVGLALRPRKPATAHVEQLEAAIKQHRADQAAWRAQPHGRGRPPNFEGRIQHAESLLEVARALAEAPPDARPDWRPHVRALSSDYHPFNLETGAHQTADEVAARLEASFEGLRRIAQDANLSSNAREGIEKAARVAPAMRETIAWFEARVDDQVEKMALDPREEKAFREYLLPAAYLSAVASRMTKVEPRDSVRATVERLRAATPELPEDTRRSLEQAATACANRFQRSSSCVEGRNGHLSQFQHALRRFSPDRHRALTVIHNYLVRRDDGTTAAERFFGAPHADLLACLRDRVPVPARPAQRRGTPEKRASAGGAA